MIQSVWKNLTGLQKAAEHLWCDFKWAENSSPNTNDQNWSPNPTRNPPPPPPPPPTNSQLKEKGKRLHFTIAWKETD